MTDNMPDENRNFPDSTAPPDPSASGDQAGTRTPHLSEDELSDVNRIFGALNSPLRLNLILLLADRDHFVNEMADRLDKSQPLISQHLRILKLAKIVDFVRQGRETVYRLIDRRVIGIINRASEFTSRESPEVTRAAERPPAGQDAPAPADSARSRLIRAPHTSQQHDHVGPTGGVLPEPDHEQIQATPALVPTSEETGGDANTEEA